MALTERLALLVSLDASGAIKGLNDVGKAADRNLGRADTRIDRTAQGFQKAGVGMLAASGLLATGLYKAGQSAADLEQAVGGTEAVFGSSSDAIDRYAKNAADKMGLSEQAFREATTSIGGQLKGLGYDTDTAAAKSAELTQVAADLAATYGGTTADAVAALGSAFRGEADPAERFNLRLNQTTVNAKAVEMGLASTTSEVSAQAKAQATLALITEQSADALGGFGREADTASGAMQIANAKLRDAKAALGAEVAPVIASVAEGLSTLASGFSDANAASGGLVSKLATYGTVGLGAAGGLSFVVGKAMELRSSFSDLAGPFRNAEGGLSKLSKVAAVAGGAFAAFAVIDIARSLNETTVNVDELAAALTKTDAATRAQMREFILVTQHYGKFDTVVKQTAESNLVAAERLLETAAAAGIAGDDLAELTEIVDNQREANVQGAKDQETNTAAIESAIGPTGELAGETGTLAGKVGEANEAYGNLIDTVLGFADADLSLRESIDKTDDALFDLAEAQQEAADKGGQNREANEALEDALFNAEGAFYAQAEAAANLAEKNAELSGKSFDAADKQKILRGELDKIRSGLAPGSPLRANIDATVLRLDALATDRKANLDITIRESRIALTAKRDGERAAGGPVSSGKTYLVGERGPELVTMGASGFVTPNNQLGGNAPNYYITVHAAHGAPGPAFARAVKDAIAAADRRGL